MTIEQAIIKAVNNGYDVGGKDRNRPDYFLDPFFWQALGKALEWPAKIDYGTISIYDLRFPMATNGWKYHWHLFIDTLANGKTPEDFFRTLE